MQSNQFEKLSRSANARRSFEEIAEHRQRRGKLNKTQRQVRTEWN
jgi:hypothetical protein